MNWLWRPLNESEHQARLESVREFIVAIAPTFWPDKFRPGLSIQSGGRYNYFLYPDEEEDPLIDFVVPELSLFVVVADVSSASWDEARQRGVSRWDWDRTQAQLAIMDENLPHMPTIGQPVPIRYIKILWGEPVDPYSLKQRFIDAFQNSLSS